MSIRVEIVWRRGQDMFTEGDDVEFPRPDMVGYAQVHQLVRHYGYKGKNVSSIRSIRIEQDEVRVEVELLEGIEYDLS